MTVYLLYRMGATLTQDRLEGMYFCRACAEAAKAALPYDTYIAKETMKEL